MHAARGGGGQQGWGADAPAQPLARASGERSRLLRTPRSAHSGRAAAGPRACGGWVCVDEQHSHRSSKLLGLGTGLCRVLIFVYVLPTYVCV